MKIIIKEIREDGSELLAYLVDANDKPILANIISPEQKADHIRMLIDQYTIKDLVKEMSYEQYLNQ